MTQHHLFRPSEDTGNGKRRPLTVIDLFAGAGGLSLGFEAEGFEILAAAEKDPHAVETFRYNHPGTPVVDVDLADPAADRSIRETVTGQVDIVLAGPPCQGFSLTGPRNLGDERNRLYMAVARVVETFSPQAFVIENVPGMKGLFGGQVVREVIRHFGNLGDGYHVWNDVLLAAGYGVPQMRRRLFIIGLRADLESLFVPPEPTHDPGAYISCEEAIGDLPSRAEELGQEEDVYNSDPTTRYQEEMREGSEALWNHVATNHTELVRSVIAQVPEGGNYRDLPPGVGTSRSFNEAWTRYHSGRPAKTIDTGHRNHFHYKWNRVPTIRENARLQSFPDSFRFLGTRTSQNRQVGNAVPPKLAAALASRVGEYLG